MRLRRRERPQGPTSPDHYTPPSFRGTCLMLVLMVTGIVAVWLAYSWALGQWTPP
jgi:hypothetical protein